MGGPPGPHATDSRSSGCLGRRTRPHGVATSAARADRAVAKVPSLGQCGYCRRFLVHLSSEYCIFNWSCEVHSMHQGCTCDPAVIPRHFPSREGYQLPQRHTALQLSRKRLRHFFVDKADQTCVLATPIFALAAEPLCSRFALLLGPAQASSEIWP